MQTQHIELTERQARQALDCITRQTTTMEVVDAQMRQLRMIAESAQHRMDEVIEIILSTKDVDLPRVYKVRLTGTTLELVSGEPENNTE